MSCIITKKPHRLLDIMSKVYLEAKDGRQVVRWCEDCGAIVIDVDADSHTQPGGLMEMTFPVIAKREAFRYEYNNILSVKT